MVKIKSGLLSAVHIDWSVGINGNIGGRNDVASGKHHISRPSARQNYKNDKQISKYFQSPKKTVFINDKTARIAFVPFVGSSFANTDWFGLLLGGKFPFPNGPENFCFFDITFFRFSRLFDSIFFTKP